MDYYRVADESDSASGAVSGGNAGRYAWLEHEEGNWHFLSNLYEIPAGATRKWDSRQLAIDELTREGWVIVGAYPEDSPISKPACGGAGGYGLMQVAHLTCEIAVSLD